MPHIRTRAAVPADEPFLREMLYEAIFVPPGAPPFPRWILDEPGVAHYVRDFGGRYDHGLIAIDGEDTGELRGAPIGAAWVRLLDPTDAGYGFVDADTPELTIAMVPSHRGRGIGSLLLDALLREIDDAFPAVSLSVDPRNPAVRLYERFGFEVRPSAHTDESVTMVRPLHGGAGARPVR